ncbi:hypothetical protein ACFW9B_10700, partial [Streptomyces yangpuensis]
MTATPRDVWLPFPAEEVAGLPDSFRYRQWDGEDAFPADPADCVFYVAPYMKSAEVTVRPLAAVAGPPRGPAPDGPPAGRGGPRPAVEVSTKSPARHQM